MMETVLFGKAELILFAQNGATNWDLLLASVALFGVLGLGIWAIVKVKQWREQGPESDERPQEPQLEGYQKMVAEGLLDPEEFARIQDQIEKRATTVSPPKDAAPPAAHHPPAESNPEA